MIHGPEMMEICELTYIHTYNLYLCTVQNFKPNKLVELWRVLNKKIKLLKIIKKLQLKDKNHSYNRDNFVKLSQ